VVLERERRAGVEARDLRDVEGARRLELAALVADLAAFERLADGADIINLVYLAVDVDLAGDDRQLDVAVDVLLELICPLEDDRRSRRDHVVLELEVDLDALFEARDLAELHVDGAVERGAVPRQVERARGDGAE